jgi:hypothetical protein
LASRIAANLGIEEGVLEDLNKFSENLPQSQTLEFTKKYIIIRNFPDCDCFKNIITSYMINAGYCKDQNDIQMLESGICIIKRSVDSKCGCEDEDEKEPQIRGEVFQIKIERCKAWCDHAAIAGSAWCSRVFTRTDCLIACLSAVELIKKWICYPCCDSGDFYKSCVKPFEDIVSYMNQPCDPYWD